MSSARRPSLAAVSGAATGAATTSRAGALLPRGDDGGFHRSARGQPVVHEDHGAIADGQRSAASAEELDAPVELEALSRDGLPDERVRDADGGDEVVVQDLDVPLGDGAHGELRLTGDAELADDEHVERPRRAVRRSRRPPARRLGAGRGRARQAGRRRR